MKLTSEDREQLRALAAEGILNGEPREVAQYFSFFGNLAGALGASDELRERGLDVFYLGEESEGDEYWHLAARSHQNFRRDEIARTRRKMESIAASYGGRYDGWVISPSRTAMGWRPGNETRSSQ